MITLCMLRGPPTSKQSYIGCVGWGCNAHNVGFKLGKFNAKYRTYNLGL